MPSIASEKIATFPYPEPWDALPWRAIPSAGLPEMPPQIMRPPLNEWIWVSTGLLQVFAAVWTDHGWEVSEGLEMNSIERAVGGNPIMWLPLERKKR